MAINRMCSVVRLNGEVGVFFDRDAFIRMDDLIEKSWTYVNDNRMSNELAQDLYNMFDDFSAARTWVSDPGSWSVESYNAG